MQTVPGDQPNPAPQPGAVRLGEKDKIKAGPLPPAGPKPKAGTARRGPGNPADATEALADNTSAAPHLAALKLDFLAPARKAGELGWLGRYRVLKVLGAGGMGMVLEAQDPLLKRSIALKVMRAELAANDAHRKRFLREARAAAAIEHDHIVAIYEVAVERGMPFIAMPFLKGEALDSYLKRHQKLMPSPPVEWANHLPSPNGAQ